MSLFKRKTKQVNPETKEYIDPHLLLKIINNKMYYEDALTIIRCEIVKNAIYNKDLDLATEAINRTILVHHPNRAIPDDVDKEFITKLFVRYVDKMKGINRLVSSELLTFHLKGANCFSYLKNRELSSHIKETCVDNDIELEYFANDELSHIATKAKAKLYDLQHKN